MLLAECHYTAPANFYRLYSCRRTKSNLSESLRSLSRKNFLGMGPVSSHFTCFLSKNIAPKLAFSNNFKKHGFHFTAYLNTLLTKVNVLPK